MSAAKTPRHIALDILCRVERGAYLDRLIDAQHDLLPDSDGDLLQHLVRGTLTFRARIDYVLTPYLKKPLSRQHAKLRNLLRLGVYQLQYLDRVPPYAVVSESVILARHVLGNPIAKLVNAVLRGVAEDRKPVVLPDFDRDPVEYLALATSHPNGLSRGGSNATVWMRHAPCVSLTMSSRS